MRKMAVKFTTREDGNGKPIEGFYVTVEGIAVGPPHATEGAAKVTMLDFARDSRRQLSCFDL